MSFTGVSGNHSVPMDAKTPIGHDRAPTPKELLLMGLGGCTAMDVVALLKKYRQLPVKFSVGVDVTPTEGQQPATFQEARLTYFAEGQVEAEKLIEAVRLSQTKYCGVSAMLSKAFPISYQIFLNGNLVGQGEAQFEL